MRRARATLRCRPGAPSTSPPGPRRARSTPEPRPRRPRRTADTGRRTAPRTVRAVSGGPRCGAPSSAPRLLTLGSHPTHRRPRRSQERPQAQLGTPAPASAPEKPGQRGQAPRGDGGAPLVGRWCRAGTEDPPRCLPGAHSAAGGDPLTRAPQAKPRAQAAPSLTSQAAAQVAVQALIRNNRDPGPAERAAGARRVSPTPSALLPPCPLFCPSPLSPGPPTSRRSLWRVPGRPGRAGGCSAPRPRRGSRGPRGLRSGATPRRMAPSATRRWAACPCSPDTDTAREPHCRLPHPTPLPPSQDLPFPLPSPHLFCPRICSPNPAPPQFAGPMGAPGGLSGGPTPAPSLSPIKSWLPPACLPVLPPQRVPESSHLLPGAHFLSGPLTLLHPSPQHPASPSRLRAPEGPACGEHRLKGALCSEVAVCSGERAGILCWCFITIKM